MGTKRFKPQKHADSHGPEGDDPITITGGTVYPAPHAPSHKGGGSDEIDAATESVSGLMSAADKTILDNQIPSTGQKSALAGTSGTPGSGNKYVTDSDSRLSDSRTPTAHATSHKSGGSDSIRIDELATGTDTTTLNATTTEHGLLKKLSGVASDVLNGLMNWVSVATALGYTPEDSANRGAANGYAPLDSGSKVPVAYLPSALMEFKGAWNASTNTPTLADGTGDNGDVYRASAAGTQNLGSGSQTWAIGDFVIYNGSIWQHSPAADGVSSIFGRTGAVSATSGDYTTDQVTEGSSLYFTTARVLATVLTGLSLATGGAIVSTDTVLAAFGKLQYQITNLSTLATVVHAATSTDPIDATEFLTLDSTSSFSLIKTTGTKIKVWLKSYFDTLYLSASGSIASGTNTASIYAFSTTVVDLRVGSVDVGGTHVKITTEIGPTMLGFTTSTFDASKWYQLLLDSAGNFVMCHDTNGGLRQAGQTPSSSTGTTLKTITVPTIGSIANGDIAVFSGTGSFTGTFVVSGLSGSTFQVTLASNPGNSTTGMTVTVYKPVSSINSPAPFFTAAYNAYYSAQTGIPSTGTGDSFYRYMGAALTDGSGNILHVLSYGQGIEKNDDWHHYKTSNNRGGSSSGETSVRNWGDLGTGSSAGTILKSWGTGLTRNERTTTTGTKFTVNREGYWRIGLVTTIAQADMNEIDVSINSTAISSGNTDDDTFPIQFETHGVSGMVHSVSGSEEVYLHVNDVIRVVSTATDARTRHQLMIRFVGKP